MLTTQGLPEEQLAGGRGPPPIFSHSWWPHPGDRPTSHTSDPYIVSAEVALDLGWIHRPPLDQHGARVENFDVFQLRFCLGIWKQPVTWMRACDILRPVQNPPSGGKGGRGGGDGFGSSVGGRQLRGRELAWPQGLSPSAGRLLMARQQTVTTGRSNQRRSRPDDQSEHLMFQFKGRKAAGPHVGSWVALWTGS